MTLLFSNIHIQVQDTNLWTAFSLCFLRIWSTALVKVNCICCVLKATPFIWVHSYEHDHYKCPVQQQKKKCASYSKASYQIALEWYSFGGHEF